MSTRARVGALVGALTILGLLFVVNRPGNAEGEKELAPAVQKIAGLIAKGESAAAQQQAKTLAKDTELEEVMNLFKPRKKHGLGVGSKAGAVIPDGIELQFQKLGRDALSPTTLNKEADALEHMAYDTAAVAEFAIAKPPAKDEGKKTVKEWNNYAKEFRDASMAFAKAVQSKAPAAVHKAAEQVNGACNSCHSVFRD